MPGDELYLPILKCSFFNFWPGVQMLFFHSAYIALDRCFKSDMKIDVSQKKKSDVSDMLSHVQVNAAIKECVMLGVQTH